MELTTSGLADRLGVKTTTITNWTKLPTQPLKATGLGRARRIEWSDYEQFAAAHPRRRGVAKSQRTASAATPEHADALRQLQQALTKLGEVEARQAENVSSAQDIRESLGAAARILAES